MAHLFRFTLRGDVSPTRPLIRAMLIPYEVYAEGRVSIPVIQYFEWNGNFGGPTIVGLGDGGLPVSFPLNVSRSATGNRVILSSDSVNGVSGDLAMIMEWVQFHSDLVV